MALRVLLLTPQFYGIEKIIKSVLEESGYEVFWIENKTFPFDYHGTRSKFKILRRIYFLLCLPRERYLKKAFRKIGNLRFDILFSINGQVVCPFLFRTLKLNNPDLSSVLYLWDSFSMYNWLNETHLFDKVYSFDPEDCLRYKLSYKPNFHIMGGQGTNAGTSCDLLFVGKFSSERLSVIDKVLKTARSAGLKYFVKLWPAYRIIFHNYIIYSILKPLNLKFSSIKRYLHNYEAIEGILKREYLVYKSITYSEVQAQLLDSNVVLDLPFPYQAGYTHRLIEALANGKKVITTNTKINNEVFYNPQQIHMINIQNPQIDISWIKEKTDFPVDSYFSDLELSRWLKSMIDVRMA